MVWQAMRVRLRALLGGSHGGVRAADGAADVALLAAI